MRYTAIAGVVVGAIMIAGCDQASLPAEPGGELAANVTPAGVVASATGSAHRIRNGELWVLAFTASKHADGQTTGRVRMDRKDVNISFDIDVTCMSVSGNTAWIAGIINNQSGGVAVDGTVSYFYVIDNGEGADAAPDIASAVRLNDRAGEDAAFCNDQPRLLPASPIDHGNIQVH